MSDFDFDELDRAVNGVIGGAPSINAPASDASEQPTGGSEETTPAPASPAAIVDTPKISGVSTPASAASTATTAPAARRSSGRFMDMVHPSSDMRTHQGNSVTPPAESSSVVTAQTSDMAQKETPASVELQASEAPDWQKPLESPFLPDAKVEKRPLGGPTEDLLEGPDEPRLEAPDEPRLEAEAMPDPIDFATASQAEGEATDEAIESPMMNAGLTSHTDDEESVLAALDAEDATSNVVEGPATEETTPIMPEKAEEPSRPVVPAAETPKVPEAPQPTGVAEAPAGPTSITQQYQEQPSSSQESGAIYDTESYHQPLAHPAKKKSGVWVFLWIGLLIVVGAGVGAALYMFVLPK